MPRFVDLGKDARIATLKGMQGAMESAWNMAHASQLAQGLTASSSITVDGITITMSDGYPTAEGLVNLIKVTGFDTSEAGTFKVKDGETARTGCQVVYTAATASGTPPVVTPPTATLTTSGC
ncbi:MAG: mannose-sensitive hemagglutinin a, partial [Magnetococcales bacterium]|nr:mannose-sensitive hemagglutinin a [Magnetococcales bacterium]